ncbi:uncharacterized protein LOC108625720 [Ceratina calcarata]|uniref:Uncharacterized protein LOC108625720 n=1 Tax=Ceratina calcarata TaxID=156304 RepID=A0AAJ7J0Y3_9HYME|nr:uncharacterized protein LOC108625720 [Ceratina calcarata]
MQAAENPYIKGKSVRWIVNRSFEAVETMKSYACFLYLSLVVATVIEAGPTPRAIESLDKSEVDTAKENLQIEEIGEEKDRSKKAVVCYQLEPQENHLAPLTIPQQVPFNVIQPQTSFVVPQQTGQQMVVPQSFPFQPIHTLQVVQPVPVQPCTSSINVIQTLPEGNAAAQKVETPRPTPSPEIETITERPVPMRIERPLPPPRESYAVLPMMSYQYSEPVSTMSDACTDPLHGLQCTCRQVQPMSMMSVMPYSSAYARSSMPMPMLPSRARAQGPQPRKKTYININLPQGYSYYQQPQNMQQPQHVHQTVNQEMYVNGADLSAYSTGGISMSAQPRSYRSSDQSADRVPMNSLSTQDDLAGENLVGADELVPRNKSPREIDSSQLSPERIEREEGQVATIDGKRDTRSDGREATLRKKQ